MAHDTFQILTFYLGAEEYGLPLVQAREILGLVPTTTLPNAAKHVVGLINLRGEILPVFDLRLLFKLQSKAHQDEQDCILVAETQGEPFGLKVDGVHQVLTLSADRIDPPSDALRERSTAISGLAKVGNRLVILLDPTTLFSEDDLAEQSGELSEPRPRRDA
jgi:purine-binding chemotaxis protein CheW